ncbi:MAG: HNH endonuclease [Bryobacterales bacterium]|nr:HNH endonuclease [Bryobacterales bacterium]
MPREFTAKSVEHVLPQNPEQVGYWAQHHDLSQTGDYVNSIGNLVLLSKSKNSAARNFDFPKKKEKYLKSRVSDYPRSLEVLGYADWDKAAIDKRILEAKTLILQDP